MKFKLLKKIILTIGVAILPFASAYQVKAESASESLEKAQKLMDDLRKSQSEISSDLGKLNSELDEVSDRIASINDNVLKTQNEISSLNDEIASLDKEKSAAYEAMKLRIKYAYESQRADAFEVLLGAEDFADMFNRTSYIQGITDYNLNQIKNLDGIIKSQMEKEEELNNRKLALGNLKKEANAESDKITSLIGSKSDALDMSNDRLAQLEEEAKAYEAQIEEERLAREAAEYAQMAERMRREEEEKKQDRSQDNNNDNNDGNDDNTGSDSDNYSADDIDMLAAIIECEAGNQSYEGRIAVGSVVMNRVASSYFPNTIAGVLYQKNQFTPVMSGRFEIVLKRGAAATNVNAAKEVLAGRRNVSYLFFHVYTGRTNNYSSWQIIGDHIFYNY